MQNIPGIKCKCWWGVEQTKGRKTQKFRETDGTDNQMDGRTDRRTDKMTKRHANRQADNGFVVCTNQV